MKVEFKHNCEIQGKKFGFEKHMVPGIHEVPGSFVFDWFFVSLVLDNHAKILEAFHSEFEEYSEEELRKLKPAFLKILSDVLEDETVEEESKDEDSEDDSDGDDNSDSDSEDDSDLSSEESEEETESEIGEEESEEVSTEVKAAKKKKAKKKGKR